jgi:hypothetical protein
MNIKQFAVGGLVVVTLLAGTAVASGAATTSACPPTDHWPVVVDGKPMRDPGVRVWHDSTGWHLRVTHNSLRDRTFSGEIVTSGEIVAVKNTHLERNDYVKLAPGKHGVAFRFNNYGGVDGFDFATHCAPSLAFGFLTDAHRVPTSRISIGADAHHPANNPFVIKRAA